MIKDIFCDLDGTLYRDGISPKDIEAINEARLNGINFNIATGRVYKHSVNILKEVASGEVVCNHKDADPTNYDVALVFDFVSFEALNAYQVHPEHLKLKALLKDKIQARSCIDYEI